MTATTEREQFTALLAREFPQIKLHILAEWTTKMMRASKRHAKLQEAQCNGDWPADNGQREVVACPTCECMWVPTTFKSKLCPDCHVERDIRRLCDAIPGIEPVFGGDPRGCTVKLKVPSGNSNDWGREGICVPQ